METATRLRLRQIFKSIKLELDAVDGKETLAEATDVFRDGIFGAKKRRRCKPKKKTGIVVFGAENGALLHFIIELRNLLLIPPWEESQIVALCRRGDVLHSDGETLFLFQEEGNPLFSVAEVEEKGCERELSLIVHPLEYNEMYDSCRIIIPKKL